MQKSLLVLYTSVDSAQSSQTPSLRPISTATPTSEWIATSAKKEKGRVYKITRGCRRCCQEKLDDLKNSHK